MPRGERSLRGVKPATLQKHLRRATAEAVGLQAELFKEREWRRDHLAQAKTGDTSKPYVEAPPAPPPADDVFAKVVALNRAIEVAWLNGYHPAIACSSAEVIGIDAMPPMIEVQLAKGKSYPSSRPLRFFNR